MGIVEQYNAIYTLNPHKWTSGGRDRYAMNTLYRHIRKEPDSLLDIGCGNGHTLLVFSHGWRKTNLYGIDLSSVAIDIASEAVPEATLQAVSLLDYQPPCKFEVVLAMGVAEHFEDIVANLKKINSMLAVSGLLYLEVPNSLSYSRDKTEGFREQGKQMEWQLERATWENAIADSGLSIVEALRGPNSFSEFIWILKTED